MWLGSTWAVTRTAVAGASLLTLLANHPSAVHIADRSLAAAGRCDGLSRITVACGLTGGEYTWLTHVVLVGLFAAVVSGLLPAVTGLLHPYAALSLMTALSTVDGGEQAALVFSVLAVPVRLADPRRSHWASWPREMRPTHATALRRSTLVVFILVTEVQISVIYLQAGIAKLAVPEWVEGTAIYYWTIDGYLPPPTFAAPAVAAFATVPLIVLGATYGTVVLELLLGVSLLIRSWRVRAVLLVVALAFHLLIALTFAIWSFALTMAGLVLLLLSPDRLADWRPSACATTPPPRTAAAPEAVAP